IFSDNCKIPASEENSRSHLCLRIAAGEHKAWRRHHLQVANRHALPKSSISDGGLARSLAEKGWIDLHGNSLLRYKEHRKAQAPCECLQEYPIVLPVRNKGPELRNR